MSLGENFRPNRGRWLEDEETSAGASGADDTGLDGDWYDEYMVNLQYVSFRGYVEGVWKVRRRSY